MDRRGQAWILNTFVGSMGVDVLHPGARNAFALLGFAATDIDKVYRRLQRGEMMLKAFVTQAAEVERKARFAEAEGFNAAAAGLYERAAMLYGRGAYAIFRDDPMKFEYHRKMVETYDKVIALSGLRAERVELSLEGKTLYGMLYLPKAPHDEKLPVIILLPGMDMVKEQWTRMVQEQVLPLGVAAFALDGPGQGESLLHGLKVSVTNYDDAGKAVVDYLIGRPEIDPGRISLFGFSFGSHWAVRLAAAEPRLKATAGVEGCFGPKDNMFNVQQPNYRSNYMYMSGVFDDDAFDKQTAELALDGVAPNVQCPFLMAQGEFDELSPAKETLDLYEKLPEPKEIWLFEDEFHPLGGVAAELYPLVTDWLVSRMNDAPIKQADRRLLLRPDGSIIDGDASPTWWNPDRLVENG